MSPLPPWACWPYCAIQPYCADPRDLLNQANDLYSEFFVATIAVLMIGVAARRRSAAALLAQSCPLVYVGRLSYGIYLIHILCINVAEKIAGRVASGMTANVLSLLVAVVLSILGSHLLHRFIEQPLVETWCRLVRSRAATRRHHAADRHGQFVTAAVGSGSLGRVRWFARNRRLAQRCHLAPGEIQFP